MKYHSTRQHYTSWLSWVDLRERAKKIQTEEQISSVIIAHFSIKILKQNDRDSRCPSEKSVRI
jgi:hypothetical protein